MDPLGPVERWVKKRNGGFSLRKMGGLSQQAQYKNPTTLPSCQRKRLVAAHSDAKMPTLR